DLMNVQYQLQHLDIKPQNLFLIGNHTKIADFGLVKDLEGMMASVTGGVTPVYAAPETFDGWVSRFCDQYSLAIVYQELLTGQRPFNGTNVRQLIMQHLQAAPNLTPLPTRDQHVVARALAKNPEDRYPTCREFVDGLLDVQVQSRAKESGGKAEVESDFLPSVSDSETDQENICETGRMPDFLPGDGEGRPAAEYVSGETRWIRVHAEAKRREEAVRPSAVKRKETRGEGLLFPALVIGIGAQGLNVLLALREQFQEEFGTLDAIPNVRWLYVDTDPESIRAASAPDLAA